MPQFDFGDESIARHLVLFKKAVAKGGQWGISRWDEFAWGSPLIDQMLIDIDGSAAAINFIVNTSSATAKPHIISGYTTHYDSRRVIRG